MISSKQCRVFDFVRFSLGLGIAISLPEIILASERGEGLNSFIQESCIGCHDESTETALDLTSLGYDLENEVVFRKWH